MFTFSLVQYSPDELMRDLFLHTFVIENELL